MENRARRPGTIDASGHVEASIAAGAANYRPTVGLFLERIGIKSAVCPQVASSPVSERKIGAAAVYNPPAILGQSC